MIISASRRTDIPALYPQWFMNRLRAGEVLVPNPYNRKKINRIPLSPDTVDCIAFWTKNPEPMIPYLKELDEMGYRYYFQMTITDYEEDLEPQAPSTAEAMATFLLLSERLGKERMDWRFDPLILTDKYTVSYKESPFLEMEQEDMLELGEGLGKIAKKYNLPLYTCSEKIDLTPYGIRHGACIDKDKIYELIGYKLDVKKDAGQRKECGCVESIDIGVYDTCTHGCRYCYAVNSQESAKKKRQRHDPQSPLLVGQLQGDEIITDKEVTTSRDNQISLFDLPEMYMDF